MSDAEREFYSTARPYACRCCGGGMRTHGIDGLCCSCYQPPPVRCELCARIRYAPGEDWQDHPCTVPGERPGFCETCGKGRHNRAERLFWREFRAAQRRKAKGYGPGTGDPFAGF